MKAAINEAKHARRYGDYPIGAVIVKGMSIVIRVGNKSKMYEDPTLHAEVVAIQSAARIIGRRSLRECIIYTTHEPCPMCIGAIIYARLHGLVFGTRIDDIKKYKANNKTSNNSWRSVDIRAKEILNKSEHTLFMVEDFMRDECKKLFLLL